MEFNEDSRALRAAFRSMGPTYPSQGSLEGVWYRTMFKHSFWRIVSMMRLTWHSPSTTLLFGILFSSEIVSHTRCSHVVVAKTCQLYPPGWLYLRRTLKEIILAAEKDGEEVLDGLYELHALYLLPPQDGSSELAPKCYKSFTYTVPSKSRAYLACKTGDKKFMEESEHLLTLRVSLNMLEGDTRCSSWPAGLLLSEFVLSHLELFHGQKCLEVGAGAGMVGVLLARVGASKVLLTDGSLPTVANMRHNLSINNVKVEGMERMNGAHSSTRVECQQLMWESLSDKELHTRDSDVILGADLIYDPLYIPHLVTLLASFLSLRREEKVPVAYIASAVRNPETMVYFLETVKRAGLMLVRVCGQPLA